MKKGKSGNTGDEDIKDKAVGRAETVVSVLVRDRELSMDSAWI